MVVDTSALIAIANREPEGERLMRAIVQNQVRRLSVGNWLELGLVTGRHPDTQAAVLVDGLVSTLRLVLVPVSVEIGEVAREACARFGRGRHKAKLNYGDCFAYATAIVGGEPLLFKGDDFNHTDVAVALY